MRAVAAAALALAFVASVASLAWTQDARSKGRSRTSRSAMLRAKRDLDGPAPRPTPRAVDPPIFTVEEPIEALVPRGDGRIAIACGLQRIVWIDAVGTIVDEVRVEGVRRLVLGEDGEHFGVVVYEDETFGTGPPRILSFTLHGSDKGERWSTKTPGDLDFRIGPGGRVVGLDVPPQRPHEHAVRFFARDGRDAGRTEIAGLQRVTFHDDGRLVLAQGAERVALLRDNGSVVREILPSRIVTASRDGRDFVLVRGTRLSFLPSGVATFDFDVADLDAVAIALAPDGVRGVCVGLRNAVVFAMDPPGDVFIRSPPSLYATFRSADVEAGVDGRVALGANYEGKDLADPERNHEGVVGVFEATRQAVGWWRIPYDDWSPAIPVVRFHSDGRHLLVRTTNAVHSILLP